MGKMFVQLVEDKIVVTRYESDGFVIPSKISQEKKFIAIINSNIDNDEDGVALAPEVKAVPREEFLLRLLKEIGDDSKYSYYCKGLYSANDMKKGITWAEVAYLMYYVAGVDKVYDWRKVRPLEGYNVCILQEIHGDRKVLNEKLAMYKNRLDMEYYLKAIRLGERHIPLPLYCAYYDLVGRSDIDTELTMDMMLKKISEHELNMLFSG